MAVRTTLYDPQGNPLGMEVTGAEGARLLDQAALIESFGVLGGFQQKHEWPKAEGGIEGQAKALMQLIVQRVGKDALIARYGKYGLRIEQVEAVSE